MRGRLASGGLSAVQNPCRSPTQARRGLPAFAVAIGLCLCACNGSRDRLLAELQSPRPEERALAVKRLAHSGRADDLVLFTQAAKDPAAMVRGEAIAALGASQDPRVVDLLGELLGDPDETVQAKAAMALADIKNDKAKAYLMLQYGRRSRSTRMAIVQALKTSNVPGAMAGVVAAEAKGVWDRNLEALTEGTLAERVGAAEELGKSGRAEAVSRLLPLIKESQVVLAAAAVRGLGNAGDRRAVGPISELLSENFPELRDAACQSLLRLRDPAALSRLQELAVERSASSGLATAAIIALPRGPDTDRALCTVALSGARGEAIAAGREIRRRGGCPADVMQERLRHSTETSALLMAAIGLGPTAKDLLPRLLPMLSSQDARLRTLAAEAVTEIGDASVGGALLKAYEAEHKLLQPLRADWIQQEAQARAAGAAPAVGDKHADLLRKVQALDEARAREIGKTLRQTRAPTELIPDVTEEHLRPLAAILRGLGKLRAEGAFEKLKPHAEEDSPTVRAAALAGLAYLGPEGIAIARAGLLDGARDVQEMTALALVEAGEPGIAAVLEVLPKLPGDRSRLLEALDAQALPPAAIEPLVTVVREGGAEAGTAALMLGELKARGAVDALTQSLEDPTAVARREVLIALGRIGDPRAADAIARDLYNDSPEIRAAAAEAMRFVGGPAHVDALDALKGDYYRKVRENAEAALARIGTAPQEPAK